MHRKHIVGDEQNGDAVSQVETSDGMVTETSRVPFLMLGLDLPPPPLFKDAMEKNIIPQVCFPSHLCYLLELHDMSVVFICKMR
jgi:U4/U6.U5 tri-snRNP-associated protein 2